MRRKSERTKKAKASPEKAEKPKKVRTSRRKKASSSSEAESAEEGIPQVPEAMAAVETSSEHAPPPAEALSGDDKVWQVKAAESSSGTGEIKKLKICLSTRPSSTPEPERSPRGRKKLNRTVSSSDTPSEAPEEKRRSRHRSRRLARESKDETDRIHESRSEDEEHKASKPKSSNEDNDDTDVKKDELEEPIPTEVRPESTTGELAPAAETVTATPAASKKDEAKTISNNTVTEDIAHQADTTGENNHQVVKDTNRPKELRRSRRLSRSSCDREPSPEQSKPEQLIKITEEPEEPTQSEQAKSPDVSKEVAFKKTDEVVEISEHSEPKSQEPQVIELTSEENKSGDTPAVTEALPEKPEQTQLAETDAPEQQPEKYSDEIKSKHISAKSPSPKAEEPLMLQPEPDDLFEEQTPRSSKRESSVVEKDDAHNTTFHSEVPNHSKEGEGSVEEAGKNTEDLVETYPATPIVVSRKRRWGSRVSKSSQPRPVSISTDVLKDIIPDVKPAELDEVIQEKRHRRKSENMEKPRVERPVLPKIIIDNTENVNLHRREKEREPKEKTSEAPLMEHRKISLVKENNFIGRPPSPPRHKSSSILFITNLVRPFTLAQLKNLLQRTGKIVPDGFWIDRIKSKCFVTYENEEQAVETRHALHGVTWPVSNPKTLQVDFSSQEALERTRAVEEETKDQVSAIPGTVEDWLREQDAKKEKFGEMDESKPWDRRNIVREWDVGKGEKDKERHKRDERPLEKRRQKSPERSPEPARKFKKKEEEAPAKMLDDLFRKTKTIPCIYWLPLSAETIAVKEEQRRQHMAEHERRMQELERSRTHRRH